MFRIVLTLLRMQGMPVYLITFHAYRSWSEDNPRGYVQRGQPGIQPPSSALERYRNKIAKRMPVRFSLSQRQQLLEMYCDICTRRSWTPYAGAITDTHLHLLLSWKTWQPLKHVTWTLKRLLGMSLSKQANVTGSQWFSRGCDRKRIHDHDHFTHLMDTYLPRHADSDTGLFWRNPEY